MGQRSACLWDCLALLDGDTRDVSQAPFRPVVGGGFVFLSRRDGSVEMEILQDDKAVLQDDNVDDGS